MRLRLDPAAADAVARRFEADWQRVRAQTDATVAEASRLKQDPGKDYWQAERRARVRAETARAVADAIAEIANG